MLVAGRGGARCNGREGALTRLPEPPRGYSCAHCDGRRPVARRWWAVVDVQSAVHRQARRSEKFDGTCRGASPLQSVRPQGHVPSVVLQILITKARQRWPRRDQDQPSRVCRALLPPIRCCALLCAAPREPLPSPSPSGRRVSRSPQPAAHRIGRRALPSLAGLAPRPSFVVAPFLLDRRCVSALGPPNHSRRRRNALRSVTRSFNPRPDLRPRALRCGLPSLRRSMPLVTRTSRPQSLQQSRPSLNACHPGPRTARVPHPHSPWTSTRCYRPQTRPRRPLLLLLRRRRTMPRSRRASAPSASRCPRGLPRA